MSNVVSLLSINEVSPQYMANTYRRNGLCRLSRSSAITQTRSGLAEIDRVNLNLVLEKSITVSRRAARYQEALRSNPVRVLFNSFSHRFVPVSAREMIP